jgi:hypothetical protein
MIENPPPGSTINRKRLVRRIKAIFLFVIHPSQPLDPSNPRSKPSKAQSGGGIRPAYWYVDLKNSGTVARGQPPKTLLGRKRKADVVIECSEYEIRVIFVIWFSVSFSPFGSGSRSGRHCYRTLICYPGVQQWSSEYYL